MNKLTHSNSKTKQKPKGESPSQVVSHPSQPSHMSSSSRRFSQREINVVGESNEGRSGGGDGEDPL